MRIGAISDIHVDVNSKYPVVDTICAEVKKRQLDILLLAGDISNNYKQSLSVLDEILSYTGIPVYFVPGNHDMWCSGKEKRNADILYALYSKHPQCLCGKIIDLMSSWVVLGDIGWYDYSFGSPAYSQEDFALRKNGRKVWQDRNMVLWQQSDQEVHRRMMQNLEEKLLSCRGKQVIAVTHMICIPEFKVPLVRPGWDYFNAFLGSEDYGKLFEKYEVSYSFMGHVHFRKQLVRNGVDYRCVCLNYHTEWRTSDITSEVAAAMQTIEIQ